MKQAYERGDYAAIQKQRDLQSNDLAPIFENIRQRAENAFFRMLNPSDNTVYYMSIAGPASKPVSYMVRKNNQALIATPSSFASKNCFEIVF